MTDASGLAAADVLLDRLVRAAEAATTLGLDPIPATEAAAVIRARGGFPGDLYVLALAGGTGVGKSSILNALAGDDLSDTGVQRPTTTHAVAWVPAAHADATGPLLDWLGGATVRLRPAADDAAPDPLAQVVLLDLPDLDSVAAEHAARVDAALPRVDAVAWVSDPEKYADSVLHDRYLARWASRLARQAFVLNKTDRVTSGDLPMLRDDVAARLAQEHLPSMPILPVSAHGDLDALRGWLADGVHARDVVRDRQGRAATAALADLARAAGTDGPLPPEPLLTADRRRAAIDATTAAVLDVVGLTGLRAQAIAATRQAARGQGGGLLARIRGLLDRGTGRPERLADPQGYLLRWRDRGSLVPATLPVRAAIAEGLAALPPAARGAAAATGDSDGLVTRLAAAVDRTVTGPAASAPLPTSRAWPLIGLGQVLATVALITGVAWIVAGFATGSQLPAAAIDLPILGGMPMPALLVLIGILGTWGLSWLLVRHADRLGGRWADRLAADLRTGVADAVDATALGSLGAWDAARRQLWQVARDVPAT
ncbi:MAG: 50S ribosome-binding GTPase [Chloroflexi bacterium]|nr:50S ribosome-binding GTPase [Chloroflexota bacterium]